MSKIDRIAVIDGWRAVAILVVLLSHSIAFYRFSENFPGGVLGVDIFFVISGYIITARLLEEEKTNGALRKFYFRRAFRILPPILAYLLILYAISSFFPIVSIQEVLASLFFFRNYQLAIQYYSDFTMHFWSLSIEEHFYLLWPAILLCVGRKRALPIAVFGAVTCALWRAYDSPTTFLTRLFPAGGESAFYRVIRTDERLDGLLVGCTLAILLSRKEVREFIFRNFPKETPILCAFPMFLLLLDARGFPKLAIYALIATAISSTLVAEAGIITKLLELKPLVWIGQLSFSLYIWQQLFLFHFWQRLFIFLKIRLPLSDTAFLPINLGCAFIAAACSYYLIEQPCIAFGRRLLRKMRRQTAAGAVQPVLRGWPRHSLETNPN